jgi:hypothetical protein
VKFLLPLVLLSSAAFAAGPRTTIRLPDGCAFEAVDEGAATPPASRCAQMLQNLNRIFAASPLKEGCPDWPDMESATLGTDVGGLEFWPLGRGRFLLRVRCMQGAYNEASYVFLWNEEQPPSEGAAPPLVLFPLGDASTEALIFTRAFDAKQLVLWELRKEVGDGSAGRYRRIGFDGDVPVLHEQVTKVGADHHDGYDFSKRAGPKGKGWVREQTATRGCLATVERPTCAGAP